jgi:hypothetical protein
MSKLCFYDRKASLQDPRISMKRKFLEKIAYPSTVLKPNLAMYWLTLLLVVERFWYVSHLGDRKF